MARRPTPRLDAMIDRITADRPIVAAVIDGMRNAAADPGTSIQPKQVEARAAEHIAEAVAPIVANATNNEPANASRVVTGSTFAIVGVLGMLLVDLAPMLQTLAGNFAAGGNKTTTILAFLFGGLGFGGGALALFGRLKKGLPPMTFSIYKPWTWFAPRAP